MAPVGDPRGLVAAIRPPARSRGLSRSAARTFRARTGARHAHDEDCTRCDGDRETYDAHDAKTPPPAVQPPADQAQVAELQQLVAESMQQTETLEEIDEQLAAQRQQAADEEARRQALAEREATQRAATLQALGTLRQAQALLATGNSDGVDEELAGAEAALSGRTQLDVDAAREALGRSDLFQAREYLVAALEERRALR